MVTEDNAATENNASEAQLETQTVSVSDLLSGDFVPSQAQPAAQQTEPATNNEPNPENTENEPGATTENNTVNTSTDPVNVEEYDEAKVLDFFKSKKGKEIASIDDLFKEPEVKTVNKYENISDKAKAFLEFHTETGRDYEDYLSLQKDISAIPDIELAREKVRLETGTQWTDEEVDSYLERQLGINLNEMEAADKIALNGFAKSIRDVKLAEQEKYKQPLENRQVTQEQQPIAEDEVELVTGERMKKVDYDKLLKNRQDYLDGLKVSSDNIKESSFSIKVDDKGSEKTLNYNYEFSTEDRQNMVSSAGDLQQLVKTKYDSEQGFNHTNLMEDLFWMDKNNREKAISAILHKALAGRTEEMMKEINNVNLTNPSQQSLTTHQKEGTKMVSAKDLLT